jgi:hypothetical protein
MFLSYHVDNTTLGMRVDKLLSVTEKSERIDLGYGLLELADHSDQRLIHFASHQLPDQHYLLILGE